MSNAELADRLESLAAAWGPRPAGKATILEAAAALRAYVNDWVKVSERRPKGDPSSNDVLAATITGQVVAVHPVRINVAWSSRQDGEECYYTYWKLMPSHPFISNGR